MKYLKEINIYFEEGEYETNHQEYKTLFDTTNYDTEVKIEMQYYVDKGFELLFKFCNKYDIIPTHEIMDELKNDIIYHAEEYFLYSDQNYIDYDSDLEFIINNLLYLLKKKLPQEYNKYERKKNIDDYNI